MFPNLPIPKYLIPRNLILLTCPNLFHFQVTWSNRSPFSPTYLTHHCINTLVFSYVLIHKNTCSLEKYLTSPQFTFFFAHLEEPQLYKDSTRYSLKQACIDENESHTTMRVVLRIIWLSQVLCLFYFINTYPSLICDTDVKWTLNVSSNQKKKNSVESYFYPRIVSYITFSPQAPEHSSTIPSA